MLHSKEAGILQKAVLLLLGYGLDVRWKEELQPGKVYLHQRVTKLVIPELQRGQMEVIKVEEKSP